MQSVIKNIHVLRTLASTEVIQAIESRAQHQRKQAMITFKVLGHSDNTIRIETKQSRHPAENYLGQKDLFYSAMETFKELYDNKDLRVQMKITCYVEPPAEAVTPEYIREKMAEYKIKSKQIVDDLGVTASTVSAWINGGREMSSPVKAMFYLYFRLAETEIQSDQNRK